MRIRIDRDRCEGHGQCELIAPQLFHLDLEGNVEVKGEALGETPVATLEDAVAMCPAMAIALER
jgi:ferredoxin